MRCRAGPACPARRRQAATGRDIFPLTDARHAFFGNFTPAESWLRMSEALARDGKSEDAVGHPPERGASAIRAIRSCGSASAMRWSTMRAA